MTDQEIADGVWASLSKTFKPVADRDIDTTMLYAIHESAHIVCSWVQNATLGGASVQPHGDAEGLALHFFGAGGGGRTLRGTVITAAGPLAARRYDPRADDGGREDRNQIERDLAAMCRTPEVADVVRSHVQAEAARILDENWDAVLALAPVLAARETMSGAEIQDVMADVLVTRAVAATPAARAAWSAVTARAAWFPEYTEQSHVW